MITNESASEKLNTVSRMLAYQQQKGLSFTDAIIKIKQALPEHYTDSIEALQHITSGKKEVLITGYGAGPYRIFSRLATIIREEKGATDTLFMSSHSTFHQAVVQAREYWGGFSTLMWYMAVVTLLASVCISIYAIYVLPAFNDMFLSHSQELPAFTRAILGEGLLLNSVLLLLGLIIISSLFISWHIKKRVAQFLPLSNLVSRIPGLARLKQIYAYFLYLQYTHVLIKANINPETALEYARSISRLDTQTATHYSNWLTAIQSAQKLDSLNDEIMYQCDVVSVYFGRQMILVREKLTLVTQITLGVVVGTLVIAMYLPIFKMGAVI